MHLLMFGEKIEFVKFLKDGIRLIRPDLGEVDFFFKVLDYRGGVKRRLLRPVSPEPGRYGLPVSGRPVPFAVGLLDSVPCGLV